MELVPNGLRQGLTFSATMISRNFSLRFVPAAKGKSIRAKLSVVPSTICPSFGYWNWKPYLAFVNVSQSLTVAVGVDVTTGPPGVLLGVGVLVGPLGVGVGVSVFGAGEGVKVGVLEAGVVVAVGDPTGVGVNVGVGVPPRTVRLVETNAISVSTLLPVETRARHSNVV